MKNSHLAVSNAPKEHLFSVMSEGWAEVIMQVGGYNSWRKQNGLHTCWFLSKIGSCQNREVIGICDAYYGNSDCNGDELNSTLTYNMPFYFSSSGLDSTASLNSRGECYFTFISNSLWGKIKINPIPVIEYLKHILT